MQVAALVAATGAPVDPKQPYAELWYVVLLLCRLCNHTSVSTQEQCQPLQSLQQKIICCRMGTHPNGPGLLADGDSISLKAWLDQHPAALGNEVLELFNGDLPFLFKVDNFSQTFSISKSLRRTAP